MESNKNKFDRIEEEIVYEGSANHFKGIEGVGGKLFLTSDELIFQSHKFNLQNHVYRVNIKDIRELKCSIFPPTAFFLIDKNKKKEKFVVNERMKWIEKIEELKKNR